MSEVEGVKLTKSIVPSKYGAKYRNGGSDDLAEFIKAQCTVDEKFSYDYFFNLCDKNGIAEEKVAHYRDLVAANAHGATGRARMTLRNMLAKIGRKNGGVLVGNDGDSYTIDIPTPVASGAAKAAKEKAAA